MPSMEYATTILHAHGASPEAVEQALGAIFANEDRAATFRLEGTFRAVLGRLTDLDLEAAYRYLICRPHAPSPWTPVLELGNRTDGLEAELSRALGGVAIFTTFVYDDGLSGYRFARGGQLLDTYVSDPTYFASDDEPAADVEARRGHPERFANLLPAGTTPADFTRVVLSPGWWEEHDRAATGAVPPASEDAEVDLVDETDRMRCIALALELWGPTDYPFAQDLAALPNPVVGPVIAVAFA
ncbi:MAG TPA: hypothetical protein VGR57_08785 [Ktedonobacterales bacterium]|nr:hypothetical protein [Ktedonobacterales bacterium]